MFKKYSVSVCKFVNWLSFKFSCALHKCINTAFYAYCLLAGSMHIEYILIIHARPLWICLSFIICSRWVHTYQQRWDTTFSIKFIKQFSYVYVNMCIPNFTRICKILSYLFASSLSLKWPHRSTTGSIILIFWLIHDLS